MLCDLRGGYGSINMTQVAIASCFSCMHLVLICLGQSLQEVMSSTLGGHGIFYVATGIQ